MTDIRSALGAIVDFSFGRQNWQDMAKAVDVTRSYSAGSLTKEEQFEFLDKFVQSSGLNSLDRTLGGHPDFNDLGDDITSDSTIVTLFSDLRNFSRYGLFFDRDTIRSVKQSVISSFIYIVHAYNGHVHNIPGDGLMVYFGGKDIPDDECIFNAYMAGASLIYALENHINPILSKNYGFEDKLHMRVGVEFGEVTWGKYGLGNVSEVKATGFSVDFAAKIQQLAETDEMRVGEGIAARSPFPKEVISDSQSYTKQLRGVQKTAKHHNFDWNAALRMYDSITGRSEARTLEVASNNRYDAEPNYVNPRMREILSTHALPSAVSSYKAEISARISRSSNGPFKEIYSAKRKLPKGWWIKFSLSHNVPPPHTIKWEAINNGREAFDNHLGHVNDSAQNHTYAYESTAYSGNHFMYCKIIKDGVEVARALQAVIVR